MSVTFITLPGIGGSDENHWQSIWEQTDDRFRRFKPSSWDEPNLNDWVQALDRAIDRSNGKVVLVAHSLACLLVVHWSARSEVLIAGALLVSVPDPSGEIFPLQAKTFMEVPSNHLRFPSCIVASRNDPYGSFDYMRTMSQKWGSGLVDAGESAHIGSAESQHGWLFGRNILTAFSSGLT